MSDPDSSGCHDSDESRLRESEQKFAAVFRASPVGMVIVSLPAARIVDFNERFERRYGYSREEALGKTIVELGLVAASQAESVIGKLLAGDTIRGLESSCTTKSGEKFTVELSVERLEIAGEPCALLIGTDLTEDLRTREELRLSQQKFSAAFHASPGGLNILSLPEFRFVEVNDTFEQRFGYTREEAIGKTSAELGIGDAEQTKQIVDRLLSDEPFRPMEVKYRTKSGEEVIKEITVAPIEVGGRPCALLMGYDITDRVRAVEALRISEDKFSRAFHASPDAMMIGSHVTGTVDVNDAFRRHFGYARDEVIGRTTQEIGLWRNPSDRDRVLETIETLGSTRDLEVPLLTKSGELLTCQVSVEPIEIEGEPFGLFIARDITRQRQLEEERQRTFEEIARLKDELERERDYLREEVDVSLHFGEIVGSSPSLRRVLAEVEAVAGTNAAVLIMGETGVGKELIARAIHSKSARASSPLIKVNCSSIPRELFESEFFGHVKGAFTGAHRDRVGRFELAHGGTIFLDEVSEIPVDQQAKLLRVLQEGEFERVGEDVTRRVDVRVIAATNRDLRTEAEEGRFRSDLYYRLSVFPLKVPPLRERADDVVALARHFLEAICGDLGRKPLELSQAQAGFLRSHEWGGNIRELRNVLERAAILSQGRRLRLDLALPESGPRASDTSPPAEPGAGSSSVITAEEMRSLQRQNLTAALEQAGGKVSGPGGAAELLGIKASTLTYQLKALGIRSPK